MTCPLNLEDPAPCHSCMYGGLSGCMFSRNLTAEQFAIQKGVSSVQAPLQIEAAEKRIQCGLTLLTYLDWANEWAPDTRNLIAVTDDISDTFASNASVYSQLGIDIDDFLDLANPKLWARFKTSTGATNYALHEVLLISEWQLEEITSSINPD